jgi:transposase-like protein
MDGEQVERRSIWRQRIAEQEKSGASIRAYCKQHGLAEHLFYGWRKRLRAKAAVKFALVETPQPSRDSVMIEVLLSRGERPRIPSDEGTLRMVLSVLRDQR